MSGEVTRPSPREPFLLRSISLVVITAFVTWFTYWYKNWNFEDGFVSFRIVRNLFEQIGWSYNVGERLNATASPLTTILTLILSKVVILFQRDPEVAIPLAGHILGGISILVSSICIRQLFARDGHPVLGTACALHLAYFLTSAGVWGTDVHLTCAFLSYFVFVESRGRTRLGWLILGLAFITSFDIVSVIVAKSSILVWRTGLVSIRALRHLVRRLVNKKSYTPGTEQILRPRFRDALVPLFIPVIPWFTFSIVLFDQLFPDILAAKMWQGDSGFWGTGAIYFKALTRHITPESLWQMCWLAGTFLGWMSLVGKRHPAVYLLIYTCIQQVIFTLLNIPANHSHFAWIEIVSIIGIWGLVINLLAIVRRVRTNVTDTIFSKLDHYGQPTFLTGVLVILLVDQFGATGPLPMDDRQVSYRQAALITEDDKRFAPGSLAAFETGSLGFYSRRQMLDLTGLTTRNPQFIDGKHNDHFFEIYPAAFVLHQPPLAQERSLANDPRFPFLYDKVTSIDHLPVKLDVFARTKKSSTEVEEQIRSTVKGFDPILMVNPISSPKAQCRIDTINGESMIGRTLFRTNSPILDFRGWAIRKDVEQDPKEEVRIILIGDLGKAFAVYSPRYELPSPGESGKPDIFKYAGFSLTTHLYEVPRGRYGIVIWQQGVLCGPVIGLLYE